MLFIQIVKAILILIDEFLLIMKLKEMKILLIKFSIEVYFNFMQIKNNCQILISK